MITRTNIELRSSWEDYFGDKTKVIQTQNGTSFSDTTSSNNYYIFIVFLKNAKKMVQFTSKEQTVFAHYLKIPVLADVIPLQIMMVVDQFSMYAIKKDNLYKNERVILNQ